MGRLFIWQKNKKIHLPFCLIKEMASKAEGFDYAAAAAKMSEQFATAVEKVENSAATTVATQYFDLSGRSVVNAKGMLIRVDTYSDGSKRAIKVFRK